MALPPFVQHFSDLPDPRINRCKRHALLDILVIAFLAVLCGAEGWEEMQRFGQAKQDWLKERLGLSLEHGIPTDDTFRRVFTRLDPTAFERCFRSWVCTLHDKTEGEIVSLDGQILRHSFDTAFGQEALCLVRAWASQRRLVLATQSVASKSNEIPAVTGLLRMLDLSGCLVTADAMHCQKENAAQIVSQEGDYLLALKDNHPHLAEDVAALFARLKDAEGLRCDWLSAAAGRAYSTFADQDGGHGRFEQRSCRVLTLATADPDWSDMQQVWAGLRSLVCITRIRQVGEKTTTETVYYLCSLAKDARKLARAARRHWHIENCLHYVLDVAMNADASRIRRDHAPVNFALLRSVALNLFRCETSQKGGVKARQKLAGWDSEYLLRLLLAWQADSR
jgi:predicted transposase YbfD/YdcC